MTLAWLGGSGVNNWWQGIGGPTDSGSDILGIESPRTGDTYLDISSGKLYTYDIKGVGTQHWFDIN